MVYRSLVRSAKECGAEAHFFSSLNLLRPLLNIENDALCVCTAAMPRTQVVCLHHASDEMQRIIGHKFLCLEDKAHLLLFSERPGMSLTEDCWQECFPNFSGFCAMFTKIEVDHSVFVSAPFAHPKYSSAVDAESCCRLHSYISHTGLCLFSLHLCALHICTCITRLSKPTAAG